MKHWDDALPPNDFPDPPRGMAIAAWVRHHRLPFLWLCRDQNGKFDLRFFLCDQCQKRYAMSGGTGNIWKHIKSKHSEVSFQSDSATDAAEDTITPVKCTPERLLLLALNQDISFRTVTSSDFREITGISVNRNAISALADTLRVSVDQEMKTQLSLATQCALTFDEWTDVGMNQYVRVKAHVASSEWHRIFCLDHWPLREDAANAANLSHAIEMIVRKFDLRRVLEFIVTQQMLCRQQFENCTLHGCLVGVM
jgi:hypothetical protein